MRKEVGDERAILFDFFVRFSAPCCWSAGKAGKERNAREHCHLSLLCVLNRFLSFYYLHGPYPGWPTGRSQNACQRQTVAVRASDTYHVSHLSQRNAERMNKNQRANESISQLFRDSFRSVEISDSPPMYVLETALRGSSIIEKSPSPRLCVSSLRRHKLTSHYRLNRTAAPL